MNPDDCEHLIDASAVTIKTYGDAGLDISVNCEVCGAGVGRRIEERLRSGNRQTDIAQDYPVSKHTIWRIAHGQLWKDIT